MRAKSRKLKNKKGLIRPIHITALFIILGYFLISKFVFFSFAAKSNMFLSFVGPFTFGVLTSFLFLYLFSHEDFFHFIREFERKEKKNEEKYLKRYKHFGKIAAVIVIALIGGTIFAALTVRILLNHYKYRYLILLISVFLSTIFSIGIAKGIFSFL